MGLLQTLRLKRTPRGALRPNPQGYADPFPETPGVLQQAGGSTAHTPSPITDDWLTNAQSAYTLFARQYTDPIRIEYLFLNCDEWAEVVHKLVGEVWRRGLTISPVHDLLCEVCGEPVDDPEKGCVFCGDQEDHRPPDPEGRLMLEDFLELGNPHENLDLAEVGQRKTEEMLKHGVGFVVIKYRYEIGDQTGRIKQARPIGVKAASSARLVRLRDRADHPGGLWVCISCREELAEKYSPMEKGGEPCKRCGRSDLYEAHYAEAATPGGVDYKAYYLKREVDETSWPYRDGTPPIKRLENKAFFLVYADHYARAAVDPHKPVRPDKVLVVIGGDKKKTDSWAKADADRRAKNPNALSTLHVEQPAGGLAELKMDAKVLDMGEQNIRGNVQEIRDKFEARIRAHYGISPMQSGDTETSGGLNNEGLQLRSASAVVQDIQAREEQWLRRLAYRLGVSEWVYEFPPPLEEDESRELDTTQKSLDVAGKAADLGLKVRWVDGEPRIQDGEVQARDAQMFPGLPAPGPGGEPDLPVAPGRPGEKQRPDPSPSGPPTGDQEPTPAAPAGAGNDPFEGLNGAQITALLEVIERYNRGELTRDAAVGIIDGSFPRLDTPRVEGMVPKEPMRAPEDDEAQESRFVRMAREAQNGHRPSHVANVLRQAQEIDLTTSQQLPSGVSSVLGGPSGGVEAADALYPELKGLTQDQVAKVHQEIIDAMTQPQGWSINSIVERIQSVWEDAGLEPQQAKSRARLVARMESRAISSEVKLRNFKEEEARREKEFRYKMRGADDFRTTKMSRWQRSQIPPEGVTLEALEDILDSSVELAKQGAFKEDGRYGNVPGDPIELPQKFKRRGWVTHYNDRDTVTRAV